jgi:type IV secretion system protein VirD4
MNVQLNSPPRGQPVPSQTPDKLGFFATLRGNGWIGFLSALWTVDLVWIVVSIPVNLGMLRGMTAKTGVPIESLAGLMLNLWALPALLLFGAAIANPFAWRNTIRLAFGGTAFGIVLGHLMSRMAISLLMEAFAFASSFAATNPYAQILLDHDHGKSLDALSVIPFSWASYAAVGAFVLAPFAMLAAGSTLLLFVLTGIAGALAVCVGVPMLVFNQVLEFENALHVYRYQASGLSGYIVRFMLWLRNEAMPNNPPDDSKGARFATMSEIVKLHHPDAPESMAFGHIQNPLFLKTDKHVLIMASTRSGKGVTLIIPHLLRYRGSAFVLDPKGENAKATGRWRAALNDKVYYLDPFGISGKPRARFNPLSRFTPDNCEAESKALAAALFVTGERERDHWTAAGQQLLAAIILYVYVSKDIPQDKKDLPTVRHLLLGAVKDTLNAMLPIDDADGLLRDLATSFLETPAKEFGSVVSAAQRQTEILDNPKIIACLSATGDGDEVDFAQWHTGTMTVYLCLAAPKFPVFNRWLRLVLTSALDEMTDNLDPPPLPVCFMLDELATLGHVAPIENSVGLAAGYGVQLVTVFQDVAQMRDLYKGRWASFIGNAGVRALFNLDDFETAEYWSKFTGSHLVGTQSQQQDIYGLTKAQTAGEAVRPLLSPEEIMLNFGSDKMLVLPQAAHPFITDRVPYWDDPSLKGLWDDPRRASSKSKPNASGAAPSGAKPEPTPQPPNPAAPSRPQPPKRPTPSAPAAPQPAAARTAAPVVVPKPAPPRPPAPPFVARTAPATPSARPAAPASKPAPPAAAPPSPAPQPVAPLAEAGEPREVDRYESGDITYVMFSDGAVEVRTAQGMQRFASLAELRAQAAQQI